MIGDFAEIIIRLLGGVWSVKKMANSLRPGVNQKTLKLIFDLSIKNRGGYLGITANIDGPLCLPHGFKGVFISGGATIGKNCVIFQNVTIGSNHIPTSKTCGAPTIGDDCYISAGAAIIGNISIGDNCRIGANCSVFSDLPSNCTAVVQEPRIITKDNINNKYYKWSPRGPLYFNKGKWILENNPSVVKLFKGKL